MSKNSVCTVLVLGMTLLAAAIGCDTATSSSKDSKTSAAEFDPCVAAREIDPHCGWKPHWEDSGITVNQMDGVKLEFLRLDSTDADRTDAGKLEYATLKLCFENGKLCRGQSVAVGVTVNDMVDPLYGTEYSSHVRIKFDEGPPNGATWGISDNHETIFPYGHEKSFASELTKHKKLVLEFSYYEKSPITVIFDIDGLDGALKAKNLVL
jgi:hypothetical protein